ncbi:phosphate acyltransferase [Peribacillus frigoritolerans]|nr:phosphate acyltransferase [Peribacillus frigoritolerans]
MNGFLGAAGRLAQAKLVTPVLIGDIGLIQEKAKDLKISLDAIEIYDPKNYIMMDEMVEAFVKVRDGKATDVQAREILMDENYFGTMLVHMKLAHGMVSGATHSTADTVRPALKIIKTKPGVQKNLGSVHHGPGGREICIRGLCDQYKPEFPGPG